MEVIIGIIALLIALAFWQRILMGIIGAFIFGLVGSIFGETGKVIGVVFGFISGISAQNDSSKEGKVNAAKRARSKTEAKYQDQAEPATDPNSVVHIIRCPSCSQQIRVKLPLRANRVKCNRCATRFGLIVDESGQLHVEAVKTNNQDSHTPESSSSIVDLYRILGIEPGASPDEVRAAYKKKIREYHPDKVVGLGDKLKEVAEAESKAINTAYSMLKEAGLAF